GFIDSGLPEGDPLPPLPEGSFATLDVEEAARPLVEAVRRLRPHVMSTYDENGGYPHPDHVQANRISLAAYELAADADFAPELGEPWAIAKLYYINGFHRQRFAAIARHLREQGEPGEELEQMLQRYDERKDRLLTTRIDVRDFLQVRDDALRAHATQVDPDGAFFRIPHEVERAAWGTDDYELHLSRIGVQLPETELFAGRRVGAEQLAGARPWAGQRPAAVPRPAADSRRSARRRRGRPRPPRSSLPSRPPRGCRDSSPCSCSPRWWCCWCSTCPGGCAGFRPPSVSRSGWLPSGRGPPR